MSAKPPDQQQCQSLAVNRTPLSDDVAHRPRQSRSARRYVAGGMYGAVVAGDVGGVTTIVVVDSGGVVVVVGAAW